MAKKNSSKTATEKAMQSAEPRVLSYADWKGVNFVDSPLTWNPLEPSYGYKHNQTDLPNNYLMVQNNLVTTDTLAVETRPDSVVIGEIDADLTENGISGQFTGISFMFHRWLFAVVRYTTTVNNETVFYEKIAYRSLVGQTLASDINGNIPINGKWHQAQLKYYSSAGSATLSPTGWVITEIGAYEDNLIVTATNMNTDISDEQNVIDYSTRLAAIFLAKLNYNQKENTIDIHGNDFEYHSDGHGGTTNLVADTVISNPKVSNPNVAPVLSTAGMNSGPTAREGTVNTETSSISGDHVVKVEVCYCYTTRFGSTLPSPVATIFTEYQPTLWSSGRYVNVSCPTSTIKWFDSTADNATEITPRNNDNRGNVVQIREDTTGIDGNLLAGTGITGIDFYGRDTENTDWVFIGHLNLEAVEFPATGGTSWKYVWLGNMTDISQWTSSQLNIPTENNTQGPCVSHWAVHDSKLYYWGDPNFPYRLYIGGSPGNEFSVARGLGGAWIDIEPGSGYQIMGTAKWKTNGGANIVTIMCGNANTTKVKRFNLVETNITITNEISYKGYMYEEVSNVVGCNSRYGYGVFADGLYSLTRYGLFLTTMAMEYNNQMKTQNISEVVKPLFTEQLGNRLKDARMVFIDDIIYIAFSAEGTTNENFVDLDNVILCYDVVNQAWYTFTCDVTLNQEYGGDPDVIHHILAIDSDEYWEGLGIITDSKILLYPVTGTQEAVPPEFDVLLETGEMIPKQPQQVLSYVQQIELRFDYFVSAPGYENAPNDQNPNKNQVEVLLEGVDYYGREFKITKVLNNKGRIYNTNPETWVHGKTVEMREYVEWIRVDKYVESLRMRIKGKGRFRLSHWNMKWYAQSDTYNTQWGFDAHDQYRTHHQADTTEYNIHHYINSYNNLRRAVIS